MGRVQKDWARRKTIEFRWLLGGACWDCGTTENLEFDCIVPDVDGHWHHGIEWSWRMSYYTRQLKRDNLGLRCRSCNARKGNSLVDVPF